MTVPSAILQGGPISIPPGGGGGGSGTTIGRTGSGADYTVNGTNDCDVFDTVMGAAPAGSMITFLPGQYNGIGNSRTGAAGFLVTKDGITLNFLPGAQLKTANSQDINLLVYAGVQDFTLLHPELDGNKAGQAGAGSHGACLYGTGIGSVGNDRVYVWRGKIHDAAQHNWLQKGDPGDAWSHGSLAYDHLWTWNGGFPGAANGSGFYCYKTDLVQARGLVSWGHELDCFQTKTCKVVQGGDFYLHDTGRYLMFHIDGTWQLAGVYGHDSGNIGIVHQDGVNHNTAASMRDVEVFSAGLDGVRLSGDAALASHVGVSNIRYHGLKSYDNGRTGTGAAVRLHTVDAADVISNCLFTGCELFDDQGGAASQEYGLFADGPGTVDGNTFAINAIYGNAISDIQRTTWGATAGANSGADANIELLNGQPKIELQTLDQPVQLRRYDPSGNGGARMTGSNGKPVGQYIDWETQTSPTTLPGDTFGDLP